MTALPEATHNLPEYTVTEISAALKRTVEDRFGYVRVRGEISGWKAASSGHCYFRLKDESAVLDAVCWRGTTSKLTFKPEDGLEIIASGRITTYGGKSSYQIVVDRMEPAGAGALMALLEQRKQLLAKEGLFAPERKRALPFLPDVIGIVTSPTGAVIRDILHRLADRFPVTVLVWPVPVQGEGAAEQIAGAISGFNTLNPESRIPNLDLLIVARGGGSIEDLWAFNEEIVVRAAANSKIPLISAVGHETDVTLIDFAADRRAPTPTAAAEMAVPVKAELQALIAEHQARLTRGAMRQLADRQERLLGLSRGLPRPVQLMETATQRLDSWSERLCGTLPALFTHKSQQLAVTAARLQPQLLKQDIGRWWERMGDLAVRLAPAALRQLTRHAERLANQSRLLETVSYTGTLKRGFALVKAKDGTLLTSAAQARRAKEMTITFQDGEVGVMAKS